MKTFEVNTFLFSWKERKEYVKSIGETVSKARIKKGMQNDSPFTPYV